MVPPRPLTTETLVTDGTRKGQKRKPRSGGSAPVPRTRSGHKKMDLHSIRTRGRSVARPRVHDGIGCPTPI